MALFVPELDALRASIDAYEAGVQEQISERDDLILQRDEEILALQARIEELEQEPDPEPEPPTPPATGRLYGQTGKHWPKRTPKLTDSCDFVQDIPATAAALATAINEANTPNNVGKTARINILQGNLTGLGGGATSPAVLQNIGVANRAGGRILITPKNGPGTVNIVGSSARFYKVRGVSFVGINGWAWGQAQVDAKGVLFSGCQDMAWAWSKSRYANFTNNDLASTDVELVEVVAPDSFLWPAPPNSGAADRWQWKNGSTALASNVISVIGCYLAPVRTQDGDAAHLDAWQIFNSGVWDVTVEDMILFAATNQGFITTNETKLTIKHSLLIGGDSVNERYKLEPNAETANFAGAPWPVNGAPTVTMSDDSWLVSTPKGWKPNYDATSGQRVSMSKAEIDAVSVYPTDDHLKSIWK